MSSPPDNMKLEGLIGDCFCEDAVTPIVVAALSPYREAVESIAEDFREDEQSWRDYRRAVWSPVPERVMDCVERIVAAEEAQRKTSAPRGDVSLSPVVGDWFQVPGASGVRARALIPPGGKSGVYLLEFDPGGLAKDLPHAGTDTSAAAAESMKAKAPLLRERVLESIMARHSEGATCDQIEAALGLTHQTCSARFNELAKAGTIVDSGNRRPTRNGRNAIVYVARG